MVERKCHRFPDVQEFDGEVLQRFHFVTELRLPIGWHAFRIRKQARVNILQIEYVENAFSSVFTQSERP